MFATLAVPAGFMIGAMVIQRRTRKPVALWIAFALALVGGILFSRSALGESIAGAVGGFWALAPIIIGAALVAVAGTDVIDGRPDEPATIAAFAAPMFAADVMAAPQRATEGFAIALLILAFISQHRAHGQRAGQIKWASFVMALGGGLLLLDTPWPGVALDWLPTAVPGILGMLALIVILTDVVADKNPDRPAIIAAAFAPALLPYGWAMLEAGITAATS